MPENQSRGARPGAYLFLTGLILSIFCFGAIHVRTFCLLSTLFCFLYLFSPFACPPQQPGTRIPALFLLGSALLAGLFLVTSPSSGVVDSLYHVISFICAWSVFSYSYLLLVEQHLSFHVFLRILSFGGISVAVLSLVHAANDTGIYLSLFSPEYVFSSQRARWPFVNPNHLGHFLILASMLTWCDLYLSFFNLLESVRRRKSRKKPFIFFTSESIWKRFRIVLLLGLGHCLQCLALFLTFSRSAYLGYTCCVIVALLLPVLYRSPIPRILRGIYIFPYFLTAFFVVCFSRIRTLFIDRVFFIESSMKQDLRQELWSQALPLLSIDHWSGLGPNGWRFWHLFRAPSLSDHFDPFYLHSDPLQYLLEYGLPGLLLLLIFLCLLFYYFFSSLQRNSKRTTLEIYLFSGLVGISIASFFDFPFHIPAIQWWTVCILGMLFCLLFWSRDPSNSTFFQKLSGNNEETS